MPQRIHRQSAALKAHHRAASGGAGKVGLNHLQITQKDPHAAKVQEKLKRNGHSATELHNHRTTSPHPRVPAANGNGRAPSRDHVVSQKRTQTPLPSKRGAPAHKADFTLAGSTGTDDDEWVSSESGAATPIDDSDGESAETPLLCSLPLGAEQVAGTTPRAGVALPRVETARPSQQQQQQQQQHQNQEAAVHHSPAAAPHISDPPPAVPRVHTTTVQPTESPVARVQPVSPLSPLGPGPCRETRSEAPSPSRHTRNLPRRQPLSRHSTYSDTRSEMPYHPLIRGQSYHANLKPSPLAPLTDTSEAVQAQNSSSPPSVRNLRLSPTSPMHSPMQPSNRRTSVSSARSVATLPLPSSNFAGSNRTQHDRTRTLSSLSMSASSAALSSLTAIPVMSRPGTPPMTSHFPPDNHGTASEGHHDLLPPPYLATHITILSHASPLRDCYDRVMRAKYRRP